MAPTFRVRGSAAAVVLTIAALSATGCLGTDAKTCQNGYYCPAGSRCAASDRACIFDDCGNGVVQSGEVCDDGNIRSGDGCSADCKSTELCGNGIVDVAAGEVCDGGNTVSGDGCSADCKSLELCGDGAVNAGEECDGGTSGTPNVAQETQACNSNCTWATCGDGRVNRTRDEECDRNGDGQGGTNGESATCNYNCTKSECGDGVMNPTAGETCDAGSANSDTGACLLSCKPNLCGDGHVNQTLDQSGNPKEQCDEGAANSNTGACLPSCKLNVCGDGYVRAGAEACDTGPESATAKNECPYGLRSCTLCSVCQLVTLTGPYCGDGVVQGAHGEVCDHEASFACGTCGRPYTADACTIVTRRPARGSLTVAGIALTGVTFELSDGEIAQTFEFIESGGTPPPSNLPVVIGATTADVATSIAGQVSANLEIDAAASGETVNLTNRANGLFGNKPIVIAPEGTMVLTATGMDEGTGCSMGQRCNESADCVSPFYCGPSSKLCRAY